MEKKLLNAFETSKQDIDLIINTIDIVKETKNLDKSITLKIAENINANELVNTVASYNKTNKEITIYIKELERAKLIITKYFNTLEMNDELNNGIKLAIMQYILHELEHAYQHQISEDIMIQTDYAKISRTEFEYEKTIAEEATDEILDVILNKEKSNNANYSQFDIYNIISKSLLELERRKALYKQLYEITPTERMAQINSYKLIKEILKNSDYQKLYHYYYSKLIFEEIKGYNKTNFPLIKYLSEIGEISLLEQLSFVNESMETIDLEKRLFYGLLLKEEERKEKEAEISKHLSRTR